MSWAFFYALELLQANFSVRTKYLRIKGGECVVVRTTGVFTDTEEM